MLGILGSNVDPFGYYKQPSFVPDVPRGLKQEKIKKFKIREVYSWYA